MTETIYRVQDAEGRGPYRPGNTVNWADEDHYRNVPFFTEFGWPVKSIPRYWRPGETGGCAFRSLDDLHRWFSPTECVKLDALGYSIVSMSIDRIIRESKTQLVFARNKPLWCDYLMIPWAKTETRVLAVVGGAVRQGERS